MSDEREQFQKDLLASVRQMKAGKEARVTGVTLTAATNVERPLRQVDWVASSTCFLLMQVRRGDQEILQG